MATPIAHFDAGVLLPFLADNATVTTWANKYPALGFENLIAVTAPIFKTNIINGLPVVRFNGTTQWMRTTVTRIQSVQANGEITVIAVAKPVNAATRLVLCGKVLASNFEYQCDLPGQSLPAMRLYQSAGATHCSADGLPGNPTAIVPGTFYISAFRARRGAEAAAWRGGGNKIANATFTGSQIVGTAPFAVGQRGNGTAGHFFEGDIAELIVFSRALHVAEINFVCAGLSAKYNLGVLAHNGP